MIVLDMGGDGDDAAPSTEWLTLDNGLRVEVRRLETSVSEAAANVARRLGQAMTARAEDAAKANMPMDAEGATEANPAWVQGQVLQAQIAALAKFGIVAWEGITDRKGNPLPVTPDACDAFARHPNVGTAFFNAYYATLDRKVSEGNGSATASVGASAEDTTIAGDAPAETGAPPPAESAPAS